MILNRKPAIIMILILAFGLFAGCSKQDKAVEKAPAVQEREAVEVKPPQEKTNPPKSGERTVPYAIDPYFKNASGATYVGAEKCKECHEKQYESWKGSKMAKSFENLKQGVNALAKIKAGVAPDRDYTKFPDCLRCHTTGYGNPGGFVSLKKTPHLTGIQCETCHGPGSKYHQIMKQNKEFSREEVVTVGFIVPLITRDERECMVCHGIKNPFNEKVDPKYRFDIKDRFKRTHEHFPLKNDH